MAIPHSPAAMQGQMPSQMPSQGAGQQIQLHDIHTPEQVSNFPIAPGWWILLTLIIVSVIQVYKKMKQRKCFNAAKNQALSVLDKNQTLSAKECISLLKWSAMQYFDRQHLAKLYGEHFQEFLMEQLPEKHQERFSTLTSVSFREQYQVEQADTMTINQLNNDCHQAATLWLTHAELNRNNQGGKP